MAPDEPSAGESPKKIQLDPQSEPLEKDVGSLKKNSEKESERGLAPNPNSKKKNPAAQSPEKKKRFNGFGALTSAFDKIFKQQFPTSFVQLMLFDAGKFKNTITSGKFLTDLE